MKNITYAVIMAGGEGKRLWPKSNRITSKHLLSFGEDKVLSLVRDTFDRIKDKFPRDKILVVTTKKNFIKTREELPEIKRENFLIEPEGRNTAPAICLAAFRIEKENPDAFMAIFPSDHKIKGSKKFFKALDLAFKITKRTKMLGTIGIKPNFPATGYGYLQLGKRIEGTAFRVKRFIEKPDKETANLLFKKKNFLWNSGIFIWRVSSILRAIKKFKSSLYNGFKRIKMGTDIAKVYKGLENISIDYCVLEKEKDVFTIVGDFEWTDVGSWLSLDNLYKKDSLGNIILAGHRGIDTSDSILVAEPGHLIGTIGIKGLIIVQTNQTTLVCNKDRAEEVRELFNAMSTK